LWTVTAVTTMPSSPVGSRPVIVSAEYKVSPGVHLGHEGAGQLEEGDGHLADEVREQGGSRCGESQHLEAVHNRRDMSVLALPLGVVVHRLIVHRDRLESRGMGVGQGATGRPEYLTANVLAGTTRNARGRNR
jgi:hypothetical protein